MENSLKPFEKMRSGINFSSVLESDGALENQNSWVFQKKYYQKVKDRGFNHIRLTAKAQLYVIGDAPDYTLNPEYLRLLSVAVNHALDTGLMIVLDFHHSCYQEKDKFLKIWEQLSVYFKDYPEELMYEIVNEPVGTSDEYLNDIQLEAVKIIRRTNPTRGIALACNQWNGTWKILATEWPENDDNCFLSVHNYYMMEFTHQGVFWDGPKRPGHVPFLQYEANQIKEHLDLCSDFQKLYGKKIWISECGVFLYEADPEEAAKYIEHITKMCAKFNLPYAYWEFNQGFGLYDMEKDDWKNNLMSKMTMNW